MRIKKLLKSIKKDDDIFGSAINRYCLLQAKLADFEKKREDISQGIQMVEEDRDNIEEDSSLTSYYKILANMEKTMIDIDKQVMAKRKMMLDLEKENLMTVAAAMRSIPKKAAEKKSRLREVIK